MTDFSAEDFGRDIDELAQHALSHARAIGCDHAKVVTNIDRTVRVVVEHKSFTLANSLDSRSLGIAVYKDQKKGSASINSLARADVEKAVETASAIAGFSVADANLTLPTPEQASPAAALDGLYDDELQTVDLSMLQESMHEALAMIQQEPRVALDRFETSLHTSRTSMANSNGVLQAEKQSSLNWSYLGMGREGEVVSGMDYDGGFSFARAGFEQKMLADVKTFINRVTDNLHATKGPSYKGAVIFSPRAVESLFLDPIFYHMGGGNVMDKRSRWIDKIGSQVVADQLTIVDRPHDLTLEGATAYDSDGLPTKDQTLIEKGVLKQHLHSCYTAKSVGTTSNGFAGGPFGLHIAPGTGSLEEFTKQQKTVLLVDRFSGNADPLSGDFSGVAKTSSLYENGERVGPVQETMIAGNSFDLIKNLIGLSRDTENVSGEMVCPVFFADGVTVSGSE